MSTPSAVTEVSRVETPRAARQERWPELDGLRGTAILMVFLLHYVTDSRTHEGDFGILYKCAQVFRLGWSGVDLFFVLSGFLIGGILLDARVSPNYFRTFYLRRVHRILPIYYTWIVVSAVVAYAVITWRPAEIASLVGSRMNPAVYLLFLQNIVAVPTTLFAHYMLSPTWSLAVEEQFYLVAPFLIRNLSIRKISMVLFVSVLGAPVLRYVVHALLADGANRAYILMPCRADALAMGMLAAVAWRTEAKGWLTQKLAALKVICAILAAGAVVMIKWLPGPRTAFDAAFQYSWLALLYTLILLIALLDTRGWIAKVARLKFLREWGRVSYCVYLVHLGILGACHWIFFRSLPRIDDWRGVGVTVLAAALTWTIARISWRYFEKPLIDRGHRLTYGARA